VNNLNAENMAEFVVEALERTGKKDNTLILLAGDHGLSLGRHGLLGKQNVYECSLRTPVVFVGPGVQKNERVDQPCYLFDLFPTVLDYLNMPKASEIEGQSLLPYLQGEVGPVRPTMYAAYLDVQRMVRDKRYKLIRYSVRGKQRDQLFDLIKDPFETTDLADKEGYEKIKSRLATALKGVTDRQGGDQRTTHDLVRSV